MKTAYPNTREPVSITLYRNIPFDNTYKHHSLISELFNYDGSNIYTGGSNVGSPCERFINLRSSSSPHNYIFPRTQKPSDVYNFDFANGLITKLTLELLPAETNSNYIKVVCGQDVYYYFITSISQKNFDTYELTLELDVLMTYQDEFLEGMEGIPVFTQRKHSHRYTDDGLIPYCADYKSGDSAFSGIKPSIPKKVIDIHYLDDNMKNLEGVYWLYICCDYKIITDAFNISPLYKCMNKEYPLCMLALPLGVNVRYKKSDGTLDYTHTKEQISEGIKALINSGTIHGTKVSPYPPFSPLFESGISITKTGDTLTISSPHVSQPVSELLVCKMSIGSNDIYYGAYYEPAGTGTGLVKLLGYGFVLLNLQNDCLYTLEDITCEDLDIKLASPLTINSPKEEPKLFFEPFRKYILSAQYSSDGYEIYPELELSHYALSTTESIMNFRAYATGYIGDNNFYVEVYKGDITRSVYNYYQYEKLGLSASCNYIIPAGEDALKVFEQTQQQSFYTSKVASGINSGLQIAGGVASILIGSTMTAGSGGGLTPVGMGMVAGGIGGIASGTAGIATTIKSVDAHIQDLKNTPASINISGSNFQIDDAILGNTGGLPYIVIYEVADVIKENAINYFYQYGYEIARCCYFNTDLYYDASEELKVDNNLFGRTIFNYIQIKEDITNKINADIPMIVKRKLSSIFNEGITIWNFFGLSSLWGALNIETASTNHKKWFMKNELDNTEYKQ